MNKELNKKTKKDSMKKGGNKDKEMEILIKKLTKKWQDKGDNFSKYIKTLPEDVKLKDLHNYYIKY